MHGCCSGYFGIVRKRAKEVVLSRNEQKRLVEHWSCSEMSKRSRIRIHVGQKL